MPDEPTRVPHVGRNIPHLLCLLGGLAVVSEE